MPPSLLPTSLLLLLASCVVTSPILSTARVDLDLLDVLPPSVALSLSERSSLENDTTEAGSYRNRYRPLGTVDIVETGTPTPTSAPPATSSGSDLGNWLTTVVSRHVLVRNPKVIPNPKWKPTPTTTKPALPTQGCFPGNSPDIPSTPANAANLEAWWCPQASEYAFMGFSYDQTPCQSAGQLSNDFRRMRTEFAARYVRLYGACDDADYNDKLVQAAADAKIGVYALVWFGFDGDSLWKTRMAQLVSTIKTNPVAPYVIRNIAVGSEPLFDGVLSPSDLAAQVNSLRSQLSQFAIQTTISEMPAGYQANGDAPAVFSAIDFVEADILPFFDSSATTGSNAWPTVSWSLSYFQKHAPGKVIRITQTGWPSNTNVWPANSANAVASVSSEKSYFTLLDNHCPDLKTWGVGWFAQIWSDAQLDGWGILNSNDSPKFLFRPSTSC